MDIKKLEEHLEFKEQIFEALPQAKPVYLVKYKGEMFGYYPAEVKSIEDCIAIHLMQHIDKWKTLAALLFRPVKTTTKWVNKKGWEKYDTNTQVKYITDFSKDFVTYKCKKVDLEKTELSFWDEFPVELVQANLGFTMGVGLTLGVSFPSSSPKELLEIQKKMQQAFQELLFGTLYVQTLQSPTSLNSTEEQEYLTSPQGRFSHSSAIESLEQRNKRKLLIPEHYASALGGNKLKSLVFYFFEFYKLFITGNADIKHIKTFSLLGQAFNQYHKQSLINLFRYG